MAELLSRIMPWNPRQIERTYTFFKQAEQSKRRFALSDITKEVGIGYDTVKKYRTEKWHWFLHQDGDLFYCDGLFKHHKNFFVATHRYNWNKFIQLFIPKQKNVYVWRLKLIRHTIVTKNDKRSLFALVFLLLIILGWWQITRRHYFNLWLFKIPLFS